MQNFKNQKLICIFFFTSEIESQFSFFSPAKKISERTKIFRFGNGLVVVVFF